MQSPIIRDPATNSDTFGGGSRSWLGLLRGVERREGGGGGAARASEDDVGRSVVASGAGCCCSLGKDEKNGAADAVRAADSPSIRLPNFTMVLTRKYYSKSLRGHLKLSE